jgi:hypothetical protein
LLSAVQISVSDIVFILEPKIINPQTQISGKILVSYPGKYDGVVVNTQILDSNEHVTYTSYNGKKISQTISRLFISRDTMSENKAEFSAVINFETKKMHDVKFRASIIEQHKEIESKILFAKYSC